MIKSYLILFPHLIERMYLIKYINTTFPLNWHVSTYCDRLEEFNLSDFFYWFFIIWFYNVFPVYCFIRYLDMWTGVQSYFSTYTDIADLYEPIVGSFGRPLRFHFIFYCVSLYNVLKVFSNQVNNWKQYLIVNFGHEYLPYCH